MPVQSITTLKSYFETNDVPTESQFIDVFDTMFALVSVGTIATGVWQGTKIAEAYGGTNQSTYATGDLLYATGANTLGKLAAGTNGHVLTLAAGVPTWAAASGSSQWTTSGSDIYYTTGKVFVGSTAGAAQLSVNKDANSVTQSDANGIILANATAAISGTQSISPPLVLQGNYYETTGATTRDIRFRHDVLPVQGASTLGVLHGYYQLAANTKAGGYITLLTIDDLGGTIFNLQRGAVGISSAFRINMTDQFATCYAQFVNNGGAGLRIDSVATGGGYLSLNAANTTCDVQGSKYLQIYGQSVDASFGVSNLKEMIFAKYSNGRIGVFTTAPVAKFDALIASDNFVVSYNSTNYFKIAIDANANPTFDLVAASGTPVFTFAKSVTMADAKDLIFGSTTGTKIATATSQKIGFWNATPIIQPTTAITSASFSAGGGAAVDDLATFDGYTIGQVIKALRNAGLLA